MRDDVGIVPYIFSVYGKKKSPVSWTRRHRVLLKKGKKMKKRIAFITSSINQGY